MGTTAPSWVGIDKIVVLPEYQMREKLSASTVTEYAELIQANGSKWPFSSPCSIMRVKGELILTDGFHRVAAMRKAGEDQISVVICDGTKTDALKAALSANISHGLRRSNADKRRAVEMALADATLQKWSDNKIADLCGVSNHFVASIRGEAGTDPTSPEVETRTGANGVAQPASKADAEMQRKKIVAAIVANEGESDRKIAEMVGCDHKTVGKVRREMEPEEDSEDVDDEPAPEVVEQDEDDSDEQEEESPVVEERRDMLDMFEDMKQLIRDAMHKFPVNQRLKIWPQLIEQLSQENIEQW